MYCRKCGSPLPADAAFCPDCGAPVRYTTSQQPSDSPFQSYETGYHYKERLLGIILCCLGFFSVAGLHRFYAGKIGTGILWLLTGGCFLIGTIVDLVQLINGNFLDSNGYPFV